MSIKKKDNLYNLVKSLNKNEKKFLREFLKSQSQDKQYLLLFNKIDKQSKSREEDIKKLFDNKSKQLPVIKNYLIELMQKILVIFHRNSSSFNIIHNNFLKIQICLEKELYDIAEFLINKTIKICQQEKLLYELLQSYQFQKKLLFNTLSPASEILKKEINKITEEQNQLLEQIYNLNIYQSLQASFYDHFHQSTGINSTLYTDLHRNPLLIKDSEAKTLEAQLIQAKLNINLAIIKDKNLDKANQFAQKGIRLIEITPHGIQNYIQEYLSFLEEQAQIHKLNNNYSEQAQTLSQIRNTLSNPKLDIQKPYLLQYIMHSLIEELQLYKTIKETNKAENLIRIIQSIDPILNSPSLKQWKAVLGYEIAKFYFEANSLNKSHQQIKEILKSDYIERETGYKLSILLLLCQIAIQQKNNLLLNQTLKKLKLFFKENQKPGHLENHLINFLENYPTLSNNPQKNSKILEKLEIIKASANRKTSQYLVEFLLWLNSYIQNQYALK